MPCLVALLALSAPRLAIILVVIFSDYIGRAVGDKVFLPVLAFLFMPLTLLAYCFAINSNGSVSGWYWVPVIVAACADLGLFSGGARSSRKRMRRSQD